MSVCFLAQNWHVAHGIQRRLTWAEIDTNDFRARMCVGEVYSPDASSRPNVDGALHILQGCEVQAIAECDLKDVVLQIESVGLPLI